MRLSLPRLAPALFVLLGASFTAKADTLVFSIAPSGINNISTSGGGAGEAVTFASSTTLDGIAFYANLPTGGNLKYFIYGSTDTAPALFSVSEAVAASSTPSFLEMTFSPLTLAAGTYYFGAVSDGTVNLGESSGSTAPSPFYSGYTTPSPLLGNLGKDTAIELLSPSAATPEPSSLALLGTGLVGALGVARKRFAR